MLTNILIIFGRCIFKHMFNEFKKLNEIGIIIF